MLIVFTGYLNEIDPPAENTAEEDIKLSKKFVEFMGAKQDIATMIQKGKGKLKWERDVPEDIQVRTFYLKPNFFIVKLSQKNHHVSLNIKLLGSMNKRKFAIKILSSPSLRKWQQQISLATLARLSMIFWEQRTRSTETWQMWETTRREPSTGTQLLLPQ